MLGKNANTRQKLEILSAVTVALKLSRESKSENRPADPKMVLLEKQLMCELPVPAPASALSGAGSVASILQGIVLPLVAGVR